MILSFNNSSELNQKAVSALCRIRPQQVFRSLNDLLGTTSRFYAPQQDIDAEDTLLIILDLEVNNLAQRCDASSFASMLVDAHLLQGVTTVFFLVADVNPDKKLATFVDCCAETWGDERLEQGVNIFIPERIPHRSTLMRPPNEDEVDWQRYTLVDDILNREQLLSFPPQLQTFCGSIYDFIQDDDNVYGRVLSFEESLAEGQGAATASTMAHIPT